jgi:hypothetical protein
MRCAQRLAAARQLDLQPDSVDASTRSWRCASAPGSSSTGHAPSPRRTSSRESCAPSIGRLGRLGRGDTRCGRRRRSAVFRHWLTRLRSDVKSDGRGADGEGMGERWLSEHYARVGDPVDVRRRFRRDPAGDRLAVTPASTDDRARELLASVPVRRIWWPGQRMAFIVIVGAVLVGGAVMALVLTISPA